MLSENIDLSESQESDSGSEQSSQQPSSRHDEDISQYSKDSPKKLKVHGSSDQSESENISDQDSIPNVANQNSNFYLFLTLYLYRHQCKAYIK